MIVDVIIISQSPLRLIVKHPEVNTIKSLIVTTIYLADLEHGKIVGGNRADKSCSAPETHNTMCVWELLVLNDRYCHA